MVFQRRRGNGTATVLLKKIPQCKTHQKNFKPKSRWNLLKSWEQKDYKRAILTAVLGGICINVNYLAPVITWKILISLNN